MAGIHYTEDSPEAGQYLQLFETTGWNSTYRADAAELYQALQHSYYLVAALDGETLVGVGRVVSDGVLYAMIYDMIVAPSHQGRGIGYRNPGQADWKVPLGRHPRNPAFFGQG